MCVVIVGSMFGLKTIHGPFENQEHACHWISIFIKSQHYEIVELEAN